MKSPIAKPLTLANFGRVIVNQVKQNQSVIYGAQAIKKHIGIIARPTIDYDVYSKQPKKSANQLQAKLDRMSQGDYYYSKPAKHKGTYKVYWKGKDNRKGTDDDVNIADFTKPKRKIRVVSYGGVKYSHLSESIKDKRRSLTEVQYKFRWKKDREDLNRMLFAKSLWR